MDLIVERVDVWVAEIEDQPGALATKLEAVAEAGADLEFAIARRAPEKPGTGVVFLTPLRGDAEVKAAAAVGFRATQSLHSIRVEGPNEPGITARLTRLLADADINVRGLSAAVMGTRFIIFLALDTPSDTTKAKDILEAA